MKAVCREDRCTEPRLLQSFWSYELCKQAFTVEDESERQRTLKILLCGGLAGIVTWTSIFPLGTRARQRKYRMSRIDACVADALKTRVQTWDLIPKEHHSAEARPLLDAQQEAQANRRAITRPSTLQIAKEAYQVEGLRVFFRGIGICNARAFFVNAVQFFVSPLKPRTHPDSRLTCHHKRSTNG